MKILMLVRVSTGHFTVGVNGALTWFIRCPRKSLHRANIVCKKIGGHPMDVAPLRNVGRYRRSPLFP
ncbi:hypothetical protein Y032_0400g768 [Ancylostoma ceylanicum]|uniref:Uncharacterized protein n=1 Tax=Ancylostoma ceylanicum TaxID=53326 RepID=A0A016RR38_9BILA|nr:hypothetical protein Y032_0400g768 [Ancylostoma ceylanicum]